MRRTHKLIRSLVAASVACAVAGLAIWLHSATPDRGAVHYRAVFYDAGGVRQGADVVMNGRPVGEVSRVQLLNGDAVITFTVGDDAHLGETTTAAIQPETRRAPAAMELRSHGTGTLQPGDSIPLERTTSYSPSGHTPDLSTIARAAQPTLSIGRHLDSAGHHSTT